MSDVTPVPSPCTNVCRIDARSGLCEGCLRTLDEIVAWSTMPSDGKLAVWDALPARRADVESRPPAPTTKASRS